MKVGKTEIKISKVTGQEIEQMMKEKAFQKILAMSILLYKNLKEDLKKEWPQFQYHHLTW